MANPVIKNYLIVTFLSDSKSIRDEAELLNVLVKSVFVICMVALKKAGVLLFNVGVT